MKKLLVTIALLLTTVFLFTACAKLALPKDFKKNADEMATAYENWLTEQNQTTLNIQTANAYLALALNKKADSNDKADPSSFDFSTSGVSLASHIAKVTITQYALGGTMTEENIKTMLNCDENAGENWNLVVPAYSLVAATLYKKEIAAKYTIDSLIDVLLSKQKANGGFSNTEFYDVDSTAMIMTALSMHKDKEKVKTALEKGVTFLASIINKDDYSFNSTDDTSWGVSEQNASSTAQAMLALISCGVDPFKDARFCTKQNNMYTFLMTLKRTDHAMANSKSSIDTADWAFATPQVLTALGAALKYSETGKHIYDFS